MKKTRLTVDLLSFIALLGIWLGFNPPGRFGWHRFGLTVYSGVPFPVVDLVIQTNGFPRIRVGKAH